MTVWQLCEATVPIAIGIIVDRAIIPVNLRALIVLVIAFLLLFVVLSFGYRFGARLLNRSLNAESHALRVEIAHHALTASSAKTARAPGEVLAISTSDAEHTSTVFRQLGFVMAAVAGLVGTAIYLLVTDWIVGLVVLIGVPLSLLLVAAPSKLISRRAQSQQAAIGEASASASDHMTGLRILKSLGGEAWARDRYSSASTRAVDAGIVTASTTGKVTGIGVGATGLVLAIVVLVAGIRVVDGALAVGQLIAITGVAAYLTGPVQTLTVMATSLARSAGSATRIAQYLNDQTGDESAPDAPASQPTASAGPQGASAVTFHEIPLGDGRTLTATLPAGSFAVIDAHDPSVTRTIAQVLDDAAGNSAPDDESPHVRLPAHAQGDHAGRDLLVAPHASDLFEGALHSNITMSYDSTQAVSADALRASAADEVLTLMDQGIHHPIIDGGGNLSGGQRQRISLARALHHDPGVLVLNDPTSAVDSVTEWNVAGALHGLRAGRRTTVVLTASPAFKSAADVRITIPESGPVRIESARTTAGDWVQAPLADSAPTHTSDSALTHAGEEAR